jgi:DNA-3-methyladenine glycosylase II
MAALAAARAHLAQADPVLRRLIQAQPDLDPRAWLSTLPELDTFGTLLWQILGQQISLPAARAVLARVQSVFGGQLPTPQEVLATDPAVLQEAGLSRANSRRSGPWPASSSPAESPPRAWRRCLMPRSRRV